MGAYKVILTDERFLIVGEAATLLRITPNTLYRLIARGDIPAMRVGGVIRLPVSELEETTRRKPA